MQIQTGSQAGSLRNVEAKSQMAKSQKPKAKWPKQKNICMTPIHGETNILRRLRNVEARTQMAKSQKPKAKWPKQNNLCMKPNPKAKECRPRYSEVNEHARDARKSNKTFCLMGQISHNKPPNQVRHPHCLYSFFNFLFFSFNYFNCFL